LAVGSGNVERHSGAWACPISVWLDVIRPIRVGSLMRIVQHDCENAPVNLFPGVQRDSSATMIACGTYDTTLIMSSKTVSRPLNVIFSCFYLRAGSLGNAARRPLAIRFVRLLPSRCHPVVTHQRKDVVQHEFDGNLWNPGTYIVEDGSTSAER
jgi:hypothetical protein